MTIKVTYNVTDVYVTQDVSPVYINVSYSSGSGGGSAVWGDITGTLSDQTDLQSALDGKFDDPTGTALQYIDGTGALQTFPLTLPVLQEVRNQTGATLDAGTVVYINGATGNKPTVTKAIATGDATSAQTLGMVSAAIANNGTGYVVVIGTCSGLDTSAYTEGQQLYLSYTTAGAVTTTKPYAPNHLVYVGIVTRAHPTLGTVEVRVQNGYELDEIHDVDALNPNNNDGIFYNSTTSLWEHKQISTALGYTPANAATTLTINGVTYDLSTSRTWSVGTITGSGASGQVSYWDGTTSQAGSNNLFWDNANGRLGIGTNAPPNALTIFTNNASAAPIQLRNTNAAGFSTFYIATQSGADAAGFGYINNGNATANLADRFVFYTFNNRSISFTRDSAFAPNLFIQGTNGNVLINSQTDSGQRLQVQGTTLLNGNVTFSSSTGMTWDATNSRLGIGTATPATSAEIATSGARLRFNQTVGGSIFHGIEFATSGTVYGSLLANQSTGEIRLSAVASYFPTFYSSGSEGMRLTTNRNLIIQNGGTFTDSGERLQVTGTMKVTGNTTVGGILSISASVANYLYLGVLSIENITTSSVTYINANTRTFSIGTAISSGSYGTNIVNYNTYVGTSGTINHLNASVTFAPTSGNAVVNMITATPTINQTGGANGITRGLYVNPTLTAAADFRAIETTNGKVIFGNLPTSSAGLPTGAIWNNGGVINIV